MAGLFLVSQRDPRFAEAALAEARAQYRLHGFAEPAEQRFDGWHLLHAPYIRGGPETLMVRGADIVAVAGTITVDGKMGAPALAALLDDVAMPEIDWSRIGGQFVALVRKGGHSFLFTDYFAAFQMFHDGTARIFSTSFLAAAKSQPALDFDSQGLYEHAFNVVPIGDDTVFSQLKALGPDRIVELTDGGTVLHDAPKPLPDTVGGAGERIERHRARLSQIVGAHVGQFGNRVHCPLSGGIDSRLLLAALRDAGSDPDDIYVYGPPGSEDVRLAQAIGDARGFAVNWIEKGRARLEPDAFAARTERNFHAFDALPTYGNIFDNGGNLMAMEARHADGALAASGGCGEIYRDFFYLPDRPTSAATVAATFFARYAGSDVTDRFDEHVFLERLSGKIAAAIGVGRDERRIPRLRIEHIYPRLRCRALFGREISLEARHGAYLMPFLDHRVVAEAMTLPMRLKQAGRFESELLNALDPALAAQPSGYGHHFAEPPSRRHRFEEWSSRVRPTWLRRRSYAIQRRLRPMGDEHGGLLAPDYMHRVIDPDFPAMRRWFRLDNITDSGLWRRLACLEYLAAHLGSRLRG